MHETGIFKNDTDKITHSDDPYDCPNFIIKAKKQVRNVNLYDTLENYVQKGDTLCFAWAMEDTINFDINDSDTKLPPYEFDSGGTKVCIQQFNKVHLVKEKGDYLEIKLEKRPYVHYKVNTPFFIFRKINRKDTESNTELSTSNIDNKDISYNNLVTQPVLSNNQWYT